MLPLPIGQDNPSVRPDETQVEMTLAGQLDTPCMGTIYVTPLRYRRVGEQAEKEIASVIVAA